MSSEEEVLRIVRSLKIEIKEIKLIVGKIERTVSGSTPKIDEIDIKFPIRTQHQLEIFENSLKDAETFESYVEYFNNEMEQRSAETTYIRRKCLKETIFTE